MRNLLLALAASALLPTHAEAMRGSKPLRHFGGDRGGSACSAYLAQLEPSSYKMRHDYQLRQANKPVPTAAEDKEATRLLRRFDEMNYELAKALREAAPLLREWRATCKPMLSENTQRQNTEVNQNVGHDSSALTAHNLKIKAAEDAIYDAYNKKGEFKKLKALAAKRPPDGPKCAGTVDNQSTLLPQYVNTYERRVADACKKMSQAGEMNFNAYLEWLAKVGPAGSGDGAGAGENASKGRIGAPGSHFPGFDFRKK